MRTVDEIFNEAMSLPNSDRVLLVEKRIQELWIEEAQKHIDEIRSGTVKPIPGEEVLAQV
ncbi:addiction module protein [Roseofilum reptotaenium CS-1145]|uniref:Addiction module protein n=1 Tax=Roseofilum reptotaenium AO1-A TaxID=1925591 RepID=A0A1L9QSR4_9CYAN|nr:MULTISPECIES: addiction module protein [Roseofilum]MBP0029860.1 addiction module protein [Roseofilum sp. Guam]MDB9519487.1 addiction module protein [Roseofilum reptotaenium CS-1145]OJJ25730.1 hypothetical protein BI308_09405 [Roseofilum reptotaenium AO1-A]